MYNHGFVPKKSKVIKSAEKLEAKAESTTYGSNSKVIS